MNAWKACRSADGTITTMEYGLIIRHTPRNYSAATVNSITNTRRLNFEAELCTQWDIYVWSITRWQNLPPHNRNKDITHNRMSNCDEAKWAATQNENGYLMWVGLCTCGHMITSIVPTLLIPQTQARDFFQDRGFLVSFMDIFKGWLHRYTCTAVKLQTCKQKQHYMY